MNTADHNKTEKNIVDDLKAVHHQVKHDTGKANGSGAADGSNEDLAGQLSGSDADSDQSIGTEASESQKQQQSKGSDADQV